MKRFCLLGASGSIGTQSIDCILNHPDLFQLTAFSVGKRVNKAIEILDKIPVKYVCVSRKEDADYLASLYPDITVFYGDEGLLELVKLDGYDVLINALVGYVGLAPTALAIKCHKEIALANKETLVVGGEVIMNLAKENNVSIVPIDSEHSAIFQCILNQPNKVDNLYITASGGAFRNLSYEQLADVTAADALKHPNWSMGDKITIDSATMVNKGFEIMEAHWLFDVDYDHIIPVLHPQSIVHSMVQFEDGAVLAQLGVADMRLPIQFALTYPKRFEVVGEARLDFKQAMDLNFAPIDMKRFQLLALCIDCGRKGNVYPCALNAANEVANKAFRDGLITYYQLEEVLFTAITQTKPQECVTLTTLQQCHEATTAFAMQYIKENF